MMPTSLESALQKGPPTKLQVIKLIQRYTEKKLKTKTVC